MDYCVEVAVKPGLPDSRAGNLEDQIELLGIPGVDGVEIADRYYLKGELSSRDVNLLTDSLLHDAVVEQARMIDDDSIPADGFTVDVVLHPGVTDAAAESLLAGIAEIGLGGVTGAATGRRYVLHGDLDRDRVERIARNLLANEVIQDYFVNEAATPLFNAPAAPTPGAGQVALLGRDRSGLEDLSRKRRLSLDNEEMLAVQQYFASEGREPTDVELETLAQTWSEHCVHKTFRAVITYTGPPPGAAGPITTRVVDSILDSHIRAATDTVAKPWVRSAFVDNAGIVGLTEDVDLAFKVETHNHPSALEPFGGANTGVGGVVRDVIGVSARPVANTNILCFGPADLPFAALPTGILHPRRIADGVVAGIEDYGNKMGIPTVNGAVLYDPGYTANPLVYCGCLGVLPTGSHPTTPHAGDRIVVVGGRTGRDGLRGATFSSMESDHTTSEVSGSAVQIGHPIHEKQVLDVIVAARDERLYTAITDCGAGGLSSAVGEMAETLGAQVHLERVPLKYPGLAPWEIWLSEAQERMVLAVPEANVGRVAELCRARDVEATVLGTFTGDGVLRILFAGDEVGRLDCHFLHHGIPRLHLTAEWLPPPEQTAPLEWPSDLTDTLLTLMSDPNIRSKEDIVRRYDHEVQGGTVVKPFVGVDHSGPADAAVVTPREADGGSGPAPGAALAVGVNPRYGSLDPYCMAWAVVDEAVRNAVAVGADPDRISILDNFSWGNPRLPDRLGSLVRCTEGCFDAAVAYGAPFISGKDSLNNEYTGADGEKHTIPGTLVISALGIVPDISRTVTSDFKRPGNVVYVLGGTGDHVGGSAAAAAFGYAGGTAPAPVPDAVDGYRALHRAIREGLVAACHDVSEGGLAVALAEMAIGGRRGCRISLADVPAEPQLSDEAALFSESLGRLLVEVAPEHQTRFERMTAGYPGAAIGRVCDDNTITISNGAGDAVVVTDVAAVTRAWRRHVEEPA